MKNEEPDQHENQGEELPELQSGISKVARNATQNKLIIVFASLALVIVSYFVIFKQKTPSKEVKKEVKAQEELSKKDLSNVPIERPDNADDVQMVSIPQLPDPPALIAPTPPPPPPAPVPEAPANPAPTPVVVKVTAPALAPATLPELSSIDPNKKKEEDARRKSSIMLIGGGGGGGGDKIATSNDAVSASINYKPTLSNANKVKTLGDLSYTIAQGKIIDTVLETSINTDLPGVVRGVVSRDVYAESGKNILISKGSRLIGTYSASIQMGQSRVSINWNRIIRPDGIDLQINSSGVDKLGHSGVEGTVDNKYFDVLSNALLLSVINIGLATTADKLTNAQKVTTTSVNTSTGATSTESSGKSTDAAVKNSVNSMGDTTSELLKNSLKSQPSIVIDQGTIVKVLVNQDIIFPANIANGMAMIR